MADWFDKFKGSFGVGDRLGNKKMIMIGLVVLFVIFLINQGALDLSSRNTQLFIVVGAVILYILFHGAKHPQMMMMDEATKVAKGWLRFFQRQPNSTIPLGLIKVKAAAKLKKMKGKPDRYESSFEINRRTYVVHVDPWNRNCLFIRPALSGYDPNESPDLEEIEVLGMH